IHPHFDDDPLSGSTTFSANLLFEEFADELALFSYPPDYDDYRACDIESDIREIEFLLFQGEDSDFKDSIDQSVLTHCDDLFVDPTPEMDDILFSPDNEDKVFNPVTPLSDANEDEYFSPRDDVELLLHRNPSTLKMSDVSILEGFIDEPPLKKNEDLFDIESKKNDWKKIL
nr:hypothetical protein [Tanacetum cinerariifolium]